MKKIKEYKLAINQFSQDLVLQINDLIKQGWQPRFSPFTMIRNYVNAESEHFYCQAMVKYEDEVNANN